MELVKIAQKARRHQLIESLVIRLFQQLRMHVILDRNNYQTEDVSIVLSISWCPAMVPVV